VSQPRSKTRSLWIAVGLTLVAMGSGAAEEMQHPAPNPPPADPASQAYLAAAERMHRDMAIEFSGDPDVDFARAMIAHHQGAIDMARVLLEHGRDLETRQLAEEIIAAQEREIRFLRGWLERRAGNAG
jgi:uncharacterized protein (DUF305 family)